MATRLPKNYVPSDKEPFMNAKQREYFRRKLVDWKEDIIKGTKETVIGLQNESVQHPMMLTAPIRKPKNSWNCAPATAIASSSIKSIRRCAALKTRLTAIAKKPASRSA